MTVPPVIKAAKGLDEIRGAHSGGGVGGLHVSEGVRQAVYNLEVGCHANLAGSDHASFHDRQSGG